MDMFAFLDVLGDILIQVWASVGVTVCEVARSTCFQPDCKGELIEIAGAADVIPFEVILLVWDIGAASLPPECPISLLWWDEDSHSVIKKGVRLGMVQNIEFDWLSFDWFNFEEEPLDVALSICIIL